MCAICLMPASSFGRRLCKAQNMPDDAGGVGREGWLPPTTSPSRPRSATMSANHCASHRPKRFGEIGKITNVTEQTWCARKAFGLPNCLFFFFVCVCVCVSVEFPTLSPYRSALAQPATEQMSDEIVICSNQIRSNYLQYRQIASNHHCVNPLVGLDRPLGRGKLVTKDERSSNAKQTRTLCLSTLTKTEWGKKNCQTSKHAYVYRWDLVLQRSCYDCFF